MPHAPDHLPTALADRYAVDRELGHGGMATVYLAQDLKHQRHVAIKILRPEVAEILGQDRFLREIELVARLNHPHIVPLYDSGEAGGLLFFVMPYIRGESLRALLAREPRLPIDTALRIARQAGSALAYAHARQIVHRDVKPENILLHEGEAMVTDFGIALAVQAPANGRLTGTGIALGTPDYMSPEQALADPAVDARSDLYSLASVVYEMLAGAPPFRGPTAQASVARRLRDDAPPVRLQRPDVPAAAERALQQALARDPDARFASIAEFLDALSMPGQPAIPSVAVLPFLNLSTDVENEYFADGITEDVIVHLSKVRALRVISRASVMAFKQRERSLGEIAAKLGATALVDGSVRRAGNRVRIVAELLDADTDRHLWAETYDRELTDIFAIQSDVALQIARALKAELSSDEQRRIRKEPTHDLMAYQDYVQGRQWLIQYTVPGLRRAIEFFKHAVERDPQYALAYAAMTMAYAELGEAGGLPPEDAYHEALEAARRALALDPMLGEAHCAMAYVKSLWEYDWAAAEEGLKRALELSPSSADVHDLYGRLCAAQGRYDEAISLQRRAQALDPLAHRLDVATTQLRAGRYEEAIQGAERALELDPESSRAAATLGWAYLLAGRVDDGLTELRKAVDLTTGATQWLAQLGEAYALTGRTDEALGVLRALETRARETYVSPYHFAYVYTGLGDADRAIDLLEQAMAEGAGSVYGVRGSFLFARLREHPRFQALLERLKPVG